VLRGRAEKSSAKRVAQGVVCTAPEVCVPCLWHVCVHRENTEKHAGVDRTCCLWFASSDTTLC